MKYMGDYYRQMKEYDLRTLRSKKSNRRTKLQKEAKTYLNLQETKTLNQQIQWIDAELKCRAEQTAFDMI